jgi:cytochrome P450
MHSPVPFISRLLTEEAEVEGYNLPVGTICTINILNVHHNPTVWEDPWTFDPDRFHPDRIKTKDSYAFIPFSAGPRYGNSGCFCIFLEHRLIWNTPL